MLRFQAIPVPGDASVVLDHGTHRMSREYVHFNDAEVLAYWLNDRAVGYASLRKFEGGKLWPMGADGRHLDAVAPFRT